ncbi:unnamed protein product [Rotaria sordida]|uniref:C2H2-type domain-containing protein n=1 Tax=Rotaria sordida TaxID=392033 RepID=A0A815K5V8_9BILA|nr:unnamed protein product [Rotaria sordida]
MRPCKPAQFIAELDVDGQHEQDNDDYFSTICEQMQSFGIEIDTQKVLIHFSQYRKGLTDTVIFARYFDERSVEFISLSVIRPSNYSDNQKSMIQGQDPENMISFSDYKGTLKPRPSTLRRQSHTKNDSINELFSCSQCPKKFKSIDDLKKHSIAKHAAYTSPTNVSQDPRNMKTISKCKSETKVMSTNTLSSKSHKPQEAEAQIQSQKKEVKNTSTDKLVSCSQCTQKFKSIADLKQHSSAKHAGPTVCTEMNQDPQNMKTISKCKSETKVMSTNTLSSKSHKTQEAEAQIQSQKKEKFKSIADLKQHCTAKHAGPTACTKMNQDPQNMNTISKCKSETKVMSTNTLTSKQHKTQEAEAQIQSQKKEVKNISTDKLLSGSQCTQKFKSIADLKQHCTAKHAEPTACTKMNQDSENTKTISKCKSETKVMSTNTLSS